MIYLLYYQLIVWLAITELENAGIPDLVIISMYMRPCARANLW